MILIPTDIALEIQSTNSSAVDKQLDLSGEPLIPDLEESFKLKEPMSLLEYQDLTLQGLRYEAEYSDYWNSTLEQDGKFCPSLLLAH
ncbi:hypothetical protein CIB48_g11014 [Xylaria polymorpha]|nr:hypothetical protein CIB48_g11014 [Xylaria polymorpha]